MNTPFQITERGWWIVAAVRTVVLLGIVIGLYRWLA